MNTTKNLGSDFKLSEHSKPWEESATEKKLWDLKKDFHSMQVKYEEMRKKLNRVIKKLKMDHPGALTAASEALKVTVDEMLQSAPSPHDEVTPLY